MSKLTDIAVTVTVQIWVKLEDLLMVKGDLILGLKLGFDREGIAFPTPVFAAKS